MRRKVIANATTSRLYAMSTCDKRATHCLIAHAHVRPSVLNQKFAGSRLRSGRVAEAEAPDRGEDVVGGFGTAEGCWIGVVLIEEVHDVGVQGRRAAIDSTPDLPVTRPADGDVEGGEQGVTPWRL
jgi:hypothetical protein